MIGRKRKRKIKLVAETINDRRVSTIEAEKHNEQSAMYNVPMDILELVISQLTLKENLRASVVCKRWLKAAMSVRVADKPPWLMFFTTSDNLFEFYDPQNRKSYWLELPELCNCRVCYARDGWLLLYSPQTQSIFFFSPYSRELIKLPSLELTNQIIAFSAAPTSTSCIVFTVKHISHTNVAVSTWRPEECEWTTVSYPSRFPFVSSVWNRLVYCNGLFYCLSLTGWLGVYNPEEQSWVIRIVPPPKSPESFFVKNWWKGKFITEHNGDLYVLYTSPSENPVVYKLDRINKAWVEMKSLGGLTIFGSALSSHARTDLLGMMRNSIYFTKVRFYGKRCVSYSMTDSRYYPSKQSYDWGKQNPYESIWIEPPEDTSIFL